MDSDNWYTSFNELAAAQVGGIANMSVFNMARVLPDQGGFRFDYYVDDHGKEHVHVKHIQSGAEAKLNLDAGFSLEIRNPRFTDQAVTAARAILSDNKNRTQLSANIMKEWQRYLASNPHLQFDKDSGHVVPKSTGGQQ